MFGGSGAAFYVFGDLKRTKQRREKRKAFDRDKRLYKDDGIQNNFPKITPQLRLQIRTQMLEQHRKSRNRLLIILGITAVVLAFVSYYLLFGIKVSDGFFDLFTFGGYSK
jgi:hypothetical protein